MGPSSHAPLSNLLADYIGNPGERSLQRLIELFRRSEVGVIASGIPAGVVGEFTSTSENPISVGLSDDGQGNPVVLAFADPTIFVENFGVQFNAHLLGEAVLQTVLLDPKCRGVRINSATTENSILIDRQTAALVLGANETTEVYTRRPWWKFW